MRSDEHDIIHHKDRLSLVYVDSKPELLKRLGINGVSEGNAILRLSDYGRKEMAVWKLIANTCRSDIGAKERYLIVAPSKVKRK